MDPLPGTAPGSDWARTLIQSRQTVLPKRLVDPAQNTVQQRALFALATREEAACFVNVGTVSRRKPMRARPDPDRFVSTL